MDSFSSTRKRSREDFDSSSSDDDVIFLGAYGGENGVPPPPLKKKRPERIVYDLTNEEEERPIEDYDLCETIISDDDGEKDQENDEIEDNDDPKDPDFELPPSAYDGSLGADEDDFIAFSPFTRMELRSRSNPPPDHFGAQSRPTAEEQTFSDLVNWNGQEDRIFGYMPPTSPSYSPPTPDPDRIYQEGEGPFAYAPTSPSYSPPTPPPNGQGEEETAGSLIADDAAPLPSTPPPSEMISKWLAPTPIKVKHARAKRGKTQETEEEVELFDPERQQMMMNQMETGMEELDGYKSGEF